MSRISRLILWLLVAAAFLVNWPAGAPLTIDGTASGGFTGGSSVATTGGITTTGTNRVLVALVTAYVTSGSAPTVSSVSGASLSWFKRYSSGSTAMASPYYCDVDVWYAIASGTISGATITANLSGSPTGAGIAVFAVAGANTSTPFDTNGSLPAVGSSTSAAASPSLAGISTTNANAVLFAVTVAAGANNPPSGWTTINVANTSAQDNAYHIVLSPQTSITVTFGASDAGAGYAAVVDAIQIAGSPGPGVNGHGMLMGPW